MDAPKSMESFTCNYNPKNCKYCEEFNVRVFNGEADTNETIEYEFCDECDTKNTIIAKKNTERIFNGDYNKNYCSKTEYCYECSWKLRKIYERNNKNRRNKIIIQNGRKHKELGEKLFELIQNFKNENEGKKIKGFMRNLENYMNGFPQEMFSEILINDYAKYYFHNLIDGYDVNFYYNENRPYHYCASKIKNSPQCIFTNFPTSDNSIILDMHDLTPEEIQKRNDMIESLFPKDEK